MGVRFFLLFIAASCICHGSLRVDHIVQVPMTAPQSVGSISADSAGNVIVTGLGAGGFVKKLDANGNVLWSFSNFGAFSAAAIADSNNDVYWIGSGGDLGVALPFTKRILPVDNLGSYSPGFVVKFSGADGTILWAAQIDALQPSAIAVNANGMVTIAGFATTVPAVTTANAYLSPNSVSAHALGIARLTPAGDVVFMAAYGGSSVNGTSNCVRSSFFECLSDPRTTAASVLLDPDGNIWIAGSTNEIDLPVTPDALKQTCGCSLASGDGFLAEFSPDGSKLLYATYLGSSTATQTDPSGDDAIQSAAMDDSGHIWLGGSTNGTDWPVTDDAFQASLQGDSDGFILEYDPAANRILYSTYYGTQGTNAVTGIAVDASGRPVTAGYANSNAQNPYSIGNDFVARWNGSDFDVLPMLRYGSDAKLVRSPTGGLAVAGKGNLVAFLQDSAAAKPSISGIGNFASRKASGQVSPGEMLVIAGANLGPDTAMNAVPTGGQFPFDLGGVRVLFDDVPAPLLFTSANEIRAMVPFRLADRQETTLVLENAGIRSNENRLGVVSAVPAVFMTQTMNQYLPCAAALNEDGTVNSPSNPATPGSVISIFGSGFGALTPAPADGVILSGQLPGLELSVDVFGLEPVNPIYAGSAPGEVAGLTQLNFRVPKVAGNPPTILLFAGPWPADFFSIWVAGH